MTTPGELWTFFYHSASRFCNESTVYEHTEMVAERRNASRTPQRLQTAEPKPLCNWKLALMVRNERKDRIIIYFPRMNDDNVINGVMKHFPECLSRLRSFQNEVPQALIGNWEGTRLFSNYYRHRINHE